MTENFQIVFAPSGKSGFFPQGTSVLTAARKLAVDIDSVCGGRGICGRCQIQVSTGDHQKHNIICDENSITSISDREIFYASKRGLKTGRRLGCCATIQQNVVIDVPPESQVHKQIIRKKAEDRDIILNTATRLYYVTVEEPDMHNPTGDLQRLKKSLTEQWDLHDLTIHPSILKNLQTVLRKGDWQATIAIYGCDIVQIWAGYHDSLYGIAFDVGSTTIAGHLCNMNTGEVLASSGIMNPQIRFGDDLMSRVSYVQMNDNGTEDMCNAVIDAVNDVVADLIMQAEVEKDAVLEAVFVGNPVMHHLFMGWNPTELGFAPFALCSGEGYEATAESLNLKAFLPSARVYWLPLIAGHVGADAAAVALAEQIYKQDEKIILAVDIGTNAEIFLGNRRHLLAASSPTGPAFEGAQITCGQRAAAGAIERVRIDKQTLEPKFKVIGCDLWSNEDGFADAVKTFGVTGICGSGIIEAIAEMYLSGILRHDGIIDGTQMHRSNRIQQQGRIFTYFLRTADEAGEAGVEIFVSQADIRAIQLAKAALYAGCKLLMDKLGIEKPDEILLAGAFGTHIEPKYALILGLIPDCVVDHVRSVGNAAGVGARMALLNKDYRIEIEQQVHQIEKIETALEKDFQQHFVNAMAFPNAVDPYSELAKIVDLPEHKTISNEDDTGRRRRRRG